MLNKKEILIILIISVVIAFSVSLLNQKDPLLDLNNFLYSLIFVFLIIIINIFAKKITSFYLDSEIEIKLWEINRFGFKAHEHLGKPFPLGILLPIISKIVFFPVKSLAWMACLVFEVKPKVYRTAKRHGLYSFSEMTESHIGIIAASGIIANLVFAVIGYLIGFPDFARISVYYAVFNMIPLSDLDGNKIFFGSLVLWSFLASVVLIGLLFSIFLI